MGTLEQTAGCAIDRSAEADRVIEYLLQGPRRLAVLYGRRGSRRRELVRDWVMPRIADRKLEAYYGECDPDLPRTVQGLGEELPLGAALERGGLIFMGRMERYLAVPDREKQRQLTDLLGGVERGELRGSLLLLLPKRDLAQLFAFQPVAPSLMTNMLEIEVVTFRDGLRWMGEGGKGLKYAPEAIEALAQEVRETSDGDGVELARAVDRGFVRFKQEAGGTVTLADCGTIGGVAGALEEYREAQLGKAAERWGAAGRTAVEMVLEEVASALRDGTRPELDDLALRLGISQSHFDEILQWLSGDGQLLRDDGSQRLEIVPAELCTAILGKTQRKGRKVMRASAILREGLRSWTQLGAELPKMRLEEIDAVREFIRAGEDECALMVRSLLRAEGAQDMATIRYWLRRVRSPQREVSLLIEAVFAERAEVRLRAVELLDGFDEPDVRPQLHRAAIEDADGNVRRAALASLQNMQVDELWPLISNEARALGSPYQGTAVTALRLFPNADATAVLRDLVADHGQSSEIRVEAIKTLAALGTSEAVKTLVDIGLNDEDVVDRRSAGPALASLGSQERIREAMEAIRESKAKLEQPEPITLGRAAGVVLRTALSIIAGVSTWFALIVLGRYGTGLTFLGLSVLLFFVAGRATTQASIGLWVLLLVLSYVASLLLATRAAIVDESRSMGGGAGPAAAKNARRWSLGRPLTVTLLVIDLVPFFFLHGLGHLLIGRLRRGVTLFALECFGILCLAVSWFYFSGKEVSTTVFSGEISTFLMYAYVGVGLVLFVVTFLWDVAVVANEAVFYTGRRNARERRVALYAAMASNRWAAGFMLDFAANGKGREAWWARRLVRRTAQCMPLEELMASVKAQSRKPRYLLESLKRLKTREETLRALAGEWREATPRLRRWIVDVLAGKPNERSLEQLRKFQPDLDWYGKLRYTVGGWHYRVRLWPKMVIFVGVLLLPMVLLALLEVHATFRDPVRPLLRVVQNQAGLSQARLSMRDEEFVAMVHLLAEVRPAKSINTLMNLFGEPAKERSTAWRKGVAGSLGTAACQEALGGPQRAKVAWVLTEGLKKGRLEVVEGLSPIKEDAGRCGLSVASRQELARAATVLLRGATEPEQAQMAIVGLDTARVDLSIAPLREFVLRLAQSKDPGRRVSTWDELRLAQSKDPGRGVSTWDELRLSALTALSQNGSEPAMEALSEIAGSAIPAALRAKARQLAEEGARSLLAAVKQPLDRGEYERAHGEGLELLTAIKPGPLRFELLVLLGEASYRLSLAPGGDSAGWNGKAIEHLVEAKTISKLNPDSRLHLAHSYAILAIRQADTDRPGAFRSAGLALKEDPDYGEAYCVQSWLLQQNHQDLESLAPALTAVQKDPTVAWSYDLVQDAYLHQALAAASADARRQKLTEATKQLEGFALRYKDVMWPRRRLVFVYHEYVSEFEPDRAFARTYEIYTGLEKQFQGRLSDTDTLELDTNFLESRLTSGHYQEVIEIGARLDQRLPVDNSELRVPVNVLRYAALVMKGDTAGALAQLNRLEVLKGSIKVDSKAGWLYNGSLRYLQAQPLQGDIRQRLIELMTAANSAKDAKNLTPAIFAANRNALGSGKAR